jgi:hypothetical protein
MTPQKAPGAYSEDTPHVRRTADNSAHIYGSLEIRRTAVLADLPNKVRVVPIQDFENHFLPTSRFNDYNKIYEKVEPSLIKKLCELSSPDNPRLPEPKRFLTFAEMQNDIIKVAKEVTGCVQGSQEYAVGFDSNGNKVPKGPWPEKARPDGTGRLSSLKNNENPYHWANIFRVDEFKVKDHDSDIRDVSGVR